MATRRSAISDEIQVFLASYLEGVRDPRSGTQSAGTDLDGLRALLDRIEGDPRCHERLQGLLLLMLFFGTSLPAEDLVALRRSHVRRSERGVPGLAPVLKGEEPAPAARKPARPEVWKPTWKATASRIQVGERRGPDPLRAAWTGEDEAPLSGGHAPVGPVWLDEETALVFERHMAKLQGGDLLFPGPGGKPLDRDAIYDAVDLTHQAIEEALGLGRFFPIYSVNDYEVMPTPLRLNADPDFTGKGITIAFIDSGFYPHADLTQPENRILAYVNVPNPEVSDFSVSQTSSWHGMQTSVSSAGNGWLSRGLYRGLACEANVVLLKVSGPRGIETRHILDAFRWVAKNKDRYNIRVVNVSLGGGEVVSSRESELDQAAEGLVQMGVVVVVAAGNDGHSPDPRIRPPASAPSVITVGGVNDNNRLNFNDFQMYWSSYGRTLDGVLKPDVIAPGIWVAAPLLPGTRIHEEAQLLSEIELAPDSEVMTIVRSGKGEGGWTEAALEGGPEAVRAEAKRRKKRMKLIPPHYQHVDGTSFAAPIVCSVVAQMLEANPELTPRRVKQLLLSTTDRLFQVPIEQQGHGVVHPRKCVKEAVNDVYREGRRRPPSPAVIGRDVTFFFRTEDADVRTVHLAGSFNGWSSRKEALTLVDAPDLWSITRHFDAPGAYSYKFVVNGREWVDDPENLNREPDGFGGYNTRVVLLT